MPEMSVTKAREITENPSEYTKQQVSNAKRKLDSPKESVPMNKGGMSKKKNVPVIAISVGMADMPKGKKGPAKMAKGGMANGKPHMYLSNGGSVKDNAGLIALKNSGPKGMEAYNKIKGK